MLISGDEFSQEHYEQMLASEASSLPDWACNLASKRIEIVKLVLAILDLEQYDIKAADLIKQVYDASYNGDRDKYLKVVGRKTKLDKTVRELNADVLRLAYEISGQVQVSKGDNNG